jgi:hypothetical protein
VRSQNLTYGDVDQLLPILAGRHPRRWHASLHHELGQNRATNAHDGGTFRVNFTLTTPGGKGAGGATAARWQSSDEAGRGWPRSITLVKSNDGLRGKLLLFSLCTLISHLNAKLAVPRPTGR